ncbi:unnamed protein product [Cyprideis torosa]|uniref:Uncharacterized protein n=1 Tax=Cyprideis torosa TaxID=163714 RepID=A0A7R8ZMY6_9CRUS|nr:unnamed protein product [Cyprideis torosa]CAG0896717.1 unnamed protein product [Cyprideis torosa]
MKLTIAITVALGLLVSASAMRDRKRLRSPAGLMLSTVGGALPSLSKQQNDVVAIVRNMVSKFSPEKKLEFRRALERQAQAPDGVHLNQTGIARVCDAFQMILGVNSEEESAKFWWPSNSTDLSVIEPVSPSEEMKQMKAKRVRDSNPREVDQIEDKIKDKIGNGVISITENSRNPGWSKSFVVELTPKTFQKVIIPSFWPPNVFAKKYRLPRGEL